jgi:hypothetical protein
LLSERATCMLHPTGVTFVTEAGHCFDFVTLTFSFVPW